MLLALNKPLNEVGLLLIDGKICSSQRIDFTVSGVVLKTD